MKISYLVGVDGSEWSERAVERAVTLAKSTNAEVKLIYVLDWSLLQPMIVEGVVPPLIDTSIEEQNASNKVMQPLLDKYKDAGVALEGECIWGDPVETLHLASKESHANMVFLGRRGRSRFVDLLLGSVANKLAHHAGVPVVLVP